MVLRTLKALVHDKRGTAETEFGFLFALIVVGTIATLATMGADLAAVFGAVIGSV